MFFFFDCVLKPFLNFLSRFMEESKRDRKQYGDSEREMPGQLKKHIAAWRIRDMLKELVRQGHCEDRFTVSMEEDASRVSLFSVTGKLFVGVTFHENDFELFLAGSSGRRIESLEMLKELVYEHVTDLIGWHKEIMTLGGKRR